jgi:NitT/TauT family transport system ATP-binding protein
MTRAGAASAAPHGARPLVSIRGVSKQFASGLLAIRGINLDIMDGEFMGLIGPSGCGKSTLLRIIGGLASPSAGTINWQSPRSKPEDPPDSALGLVFQDATLLPWANTIRNVMLPLKLAGAPKEEAAVRAAEMLALVGLKGFEQAYPRELSGGMKMRVSIARALVTHPKILLMDEPFAALDEITRHKLNDDLLNLWWQHRFTAVFVTHSVFESVYLAQRIVVMAARPGRVVADLANDAPYPRDLMFRTSKEYSDLARVASEKLREAIAG